MKKIIKKEKKFLIFAIILIIIRVLLTTNLPIFAIGGSICDDQLMIKLEANLLKFNWLGDFNNLTLVKGMFFPLFLAINAFLGIKYINAITIFYSLAVLIFTFVVKDLFKAKWPKYIIFVLLLFNPIMFSMDITRVYRNSISPAQVLLVFAGMIALFTTRNDKKNKWLWSIFTGLALFTFYNTREDSIWILPMIIVYSLIMIIEHLVTKKKKINIKKLLTFVLPIIILYVGNFTVSSINYMKYGVFTRIDESDGGFASAIKAIYSVPTKDKIDYVTVTKEKLQRLYKVSPTLKSISKELDMIAVSMDNNGRNPSDNEVEDGWFWWSLRFAADANGVYSDAKNADEFFKKIAKEIIDAQNKGLIEKQSIMPSSLMSPWRDEYASKLLPTLIETIKYTISYEGMNPRLQDSTGSYDAIKLFETATNSKAIYHSKYAISGWYIYNLSDYQIDLYDMNIEKNISSINCYQYEKCIIDIDLDSYDSLSSLIFIIHVGDEKIEELPLLHELSSNSNESREYYFDNYSLNNSYRYQNQVLKVYTDRLSFIYNIYQITGYLLAILGIISYLIITFIALFKNHKLIDIWLIISSILASYLVFAIGISYNEISAFRSITYMYLSGAYPLVIAFITLSLFTLIDYKRNKKI